MDFFVPQTISECFQEKKIKRYQIFMEELLFFGKYVEDLSSILLSNILSSNDLSAKLLKQFDEQEKSFFDEYFITVNESHDFEYFIRPHVYEIFSFTFILLSQH